MAREYHHTVLNTFINNQRGKTLAYLIQNFPISKEESEDIFQDSIIVLHNNALEGKLDRLTSSVFTYFLAICRNKTKELLREKGKYVSLPLDDIRLSSEIFLESKINKILSFDDESFTEQKEAIVRGIITDLPSPCNELLWGFYRDGFSLKELADQYGYSNENTVKVTKHRCCDKFKKRFSEILSKIL